jgi:hypothetical protein
LSSFSISFLFLFSNSCSFYCSVFKPFYFCFLSSFSIF